MISSLANSGDIRLKNSLLTRSPIIRLKCTVTTGSYASKYLLLNCSAFSILYEVGGEMLIERLRNWERAVDEAPIIWFITSQMAPRFISSSTKSSSLNSVCSSRPTMTLTSETFSTITFFPERPLT